METWHRLLANDSDANYLRNEEKERSGRSGAGPAVVDGSARARASMGSQRRRDGDGILDLRDNFAETSPLYGLGRAC
jgi:hypothetical protein